MQMIFVLNMVRVGDLLTLFEWWRVQFLMLVSWSIKWWVVLTSLTATKGLLDSARIQSNYNLRMMEDDSKRHVSRTPPATWKSFLLGP
ncbi:unnamed protein product [Cuscuta campestris]|uniref:Uncharacterized protein n=1 Tax=Cuscuta campestris TaxID=132261 RepID=A0A484MFP9_9ASTE|nr:unnamed protein product [Cuscuta campestris]